MFRNNELLHHNVLIAAGLLSLAQCWQTTLVLYIHVFCDSLSWLSSRALAHYLVTRTKNFSTRARPAGNSTHTQSSAG